MNTEESHDSPPLMPRSAHAHAPQSPANQLFSTKLQEEKATNDLSRSPLQWFQEQVVTPTKTKLEKLDIGPVVSSIRDVRARLGFGVSPQLDEREEPPGNAPPRSSGSSPARSSSLIEGTSPPRDGAIDHYFSRPSYSPKASSTGLFPVGETSNPAAYEKAARSSAAGSAVLNPADNVSVLNAAAKAVLKSHDAQEADPLSKVVPFGQHGSSTVLRKITAGSSHANGSLNQDAESKKDGQLPPPVHDPVQAQFEFLEGKLERLTFDLNESHTELNTGFATTCDRVTFEMQQNQQRQEDNIKLLLDSFKTQFSQLDRKHSDGLLKLRQEAREDLQSLAAHITGVKQEEAIETDEPLQPEYEDADQDAMAAVAMAKKYFLPDAEATEAQIIALFEVSRLDPETFKRHKMKYADVRGFTEAIIKDDPSVLTDLAAAHKKTGADKSTALESLREKLGKSSHRNQQLGDVMLLYLLTRSGVDAAVLNNISATCSDFVIKGHSEPQFFIERCRQGQSIMESVEDLDQRSADIARGLQKIKRPEFCETLLIGIIFKLGYSDKPSCDLNALLKTLENLKQHKGEKAHEYLNRYLKILSDLLKATRVMGRPKDMPNEGAQLKMLKRGSRQDLRLKANEILSIKYDVLPADATYEEFSAAFLKAEKDTTAAADEEKAMKTSTVPQIPSPDSEGGDQKNKTEQDPDLTFALKDARVCINYVAHIVGKGKYQCTKQGCQHKHVAPEEVGLRSEDYKEFVAVPAHITALTPKDFTVNENRRFKGIAPSLATNPVAAPAVFNGEAAPESNEAEKPTKEEITMPAINAAALCGAPLIGMSTNRAHFPSFMRSATEV